MVLLIDGSQSTKVKVALYLNGHYFTREETGHYTQSEDLLLLIDELLHESHLDYTQIKAIGATRGPGSYTSLRVSLTVANILAWQLDIPIININLEDFLSVGAKIASLPNRHFAKPLLPEYTA